MERKYYKVLLEYIDFNNDTSNMRKDYNFVENSYVTGNKLFGNVVVYEENGVFKELISGLQITSAAQETICEGPALIPEYPNAESFSYIYHINGKYPIYFIYNMTSEYDTILSKKTLKELETDEEYINYYKKFIKDNYMDKKTGDYIKNWTKSLITDFENILFRYNKIVEQNGYSDEYQEEHGKEKILK